MTQGKARFTFSSHKDEAEMENIEFLLDTCDMHPDLVAKRLGITRDALDKKLERRRVGQRDTDNESATRKGQGAGQVPPMRKPSSEG